MTGVREELRRHFSGRSADTAVAIPADERYTREELAGLPADAIACSDGCGNPLLYTDIRPGQTVVDLGAGGGIDVLLAARRVGHEGVVIGVDMTESMVRLARENVRKAGLTQIEIRQGIIEEIPVESGTVDWVISNCVINLSPEKPRVFREILRVLKPGGRMLISDTVVRDVPRAFRRFAGLFSGAVASLRDEPWYLAELERAGLTAIEVKERTVFEGPRLGKMLAAEVGHFQRRDTRGLPGAVASLERVALFPALAVSARVLAGRVSSIKVFAEKPAA